MLKQHPHIRTASSATPCRAPATPPAAASLEDPRGWETDPNAYIYFITQAAVWSACVQGHRRGTLINDDAYKTPAAVLLHQKPIFARIEQWTKTKTKFEAMYILNEFDILVRPHPVDEGDR